MAEKHMKRCLASLVIRKLPTKTTKWYHYPPIKTAKNCFKLTVLHVDKDAEQLELSHVSGGDIFTQGFTGSSVGKEYTSNARDPGSIPGLGRVPGEGKGYPLLHSGLENSMDCIGHGVTKSQTRLSDFHCHYVLVY